MKATISLKQLRTDPREYVRLLNSGYEITITEHRRPLVSTAVNKKLKTPKKGDGLALVEYIKTMPKIKVPYLGEDTVELTKRTRVEYLENKYGIRPAR